MLRTPGTPEESFADDPLRMLRAARFVAQLGVTSRAGRASPRCRRWPASWAASPPSGFRTSSPSCCSATHPRRGLELLVDTGLADVVLPELPALRMAADEHGQHKDVYAHTLQVLDQAIALETDGPDLVLRLGAPCCTTSASRPPGVSRPAGR